MKRKINYTRGEELWNSWSHAAGILLAMVVGTLFIIWAARHENGWATFGVSLYLFGMLGSYVASTVYHAIPPSSPLPTGEGQGVKLSPSLIRHAALCPRPIFASVSNTKVPFTGSSKAGNPQRLL